MKKIVTIKKPSSVQISVADIMSDDQLKGDFEMTLIVEVRKKFPGYDLMGVLDWDIDHETFRVEIQQVSKEIGSY